MDEYTRECLALEVGRAMTAGDVIDVLIELTAARGVPRHIRSDNGPEFIAQAIRRWLGVSGIDALYVEPASPWQNGYAESFHARLPDELLNAEVFQTVAEARMLATQWRLDYNHRRPHSSLGYVTPAAFAGSLAVPAVGAAPSLRSSKRRERNWSYSHNGWYQEWGQATYAHPLRAVVSVVGAVAAEESELPVAFDGAYVRGNDQFHTLTVRYSPLQ